MAQVRLAAGGEMRFTVDANDCNEAGAAAREWINKNLRDEGYRGPCEIASVKTV